MSDNPNPTTAEVFGLATGLDTLAVGSAPAESFAMLDAVMTQATGMAMLNAVTAQQRDSTARMAAVTMSCATLLAYPLGALGDAPAAAAAAAAASPEGAAAPAAAAKQVGETAAPAEGVAAATVDTATATEGPSRIVDSQITDAINQMQIAVMSPQIVGTSGAGKAYQLVALTAALAMLDAAEALRGVATVATAASAGAFAKFLATGDKNYLLGASAAQLLVDATIVSFGLVAITTTTTVVKEFPSR